MDYQAKQTENEANCSHTRLHVVFYKQSLLWRLWFAYGTAKWRTQVHLSRRLCGNRETKCHTTGLVMPMFYLTKTTAFMYKKISDTQFEAMQTNLPLVDQPNRVRPQYELNILSRSGQHQAEHTDAFRRQMVSPRQILLRTGTSNTSPVLN